MLQLFTMESSSPVTVNPVYKKKSRLNTNEERNKMKRERRKRKRNPQICDLEQGNHDHGEISRSQPLPSKLPAENKSDDDVQKLNSPRVQHNSPVIVASCTCDSSSTLAKYKGMARYYWERWQWESSQRKEMVRKSTTTRDNHHHGITQINSLCLSNPIKDGKTTEVVLGTGSFGIVRLQLFRGMLVAVKELLPHTLRSDVMKEALILSQLSHPHITFLFGVSTESFPYKIVMQFHPGIHANKSLTLYEAVVRRVLIDEGNVWLYLSAQILDAINYLHHSPCILHNDLTSNNILITTSTKKPMFNIVVIDFGKATKATEGKKLILSQLEKADYMRRYPHIAPEVIEGCANQSTESDMYSLGDILLFIYDHGCLSFLNSQLHSQFGKMATKCRLVVSNQRSTAKEALESIQSLIQKYES